MKRDRALIVELNPYHGVILPGLHYLLSQKFHLVDLLIRTEVAEEDPFTIYGDRQPNIKAGNANYIKNFLKNLSADNYDVVFFASNALMEPGYFVGSVFKYLGFIPRAKVGTLYIEHNLNLIGEDDSQILMTNNRVATLLPFSYMGKKTQMINPHYYGKVAPKTSINSKPRIVVLGASSHSEYSFNLLFHAVRNNREYDFQIVILNGEKVEIPSDLRQIIFTTGRLSFKPYYELIASSDFLLTIFTGDNLKPDKYLKGSASGTVLASLGFKKPMIIDSVHAELYGFNKSEAIRFAFNDVATGLGRALNTKQKKYTQLIESLAAKSNAVQSASLDTIELMVSKMEKKKGLLVAEEDKRTMLLADNNKQIGELTNNLNVVNAELQHLKDENKNLKNENSELRVHINELWVHLHSQRFRLADLVYNRVNRLAPHGSARRKALKKSYQAVSLIDKNSTGRSEIRNKRQLKKFKTELAKLAKSHTKPIVTYLSMPWENVMRQRPHHLAEQIANLGCLVVYIDEEAVEPRKLSDNLLIVNGDWVFDVLDIPTKAKKYYLLSAGHKKPLSEIKNIITKDFKLIYEYIDELDETISGDLTHQKEVFSNLEKLKPALLLASAKKLHNELLDRFPKKKILMSSNAVDLTHFDLGIQRHIEDAPDDIQEIVAKGKPIVGYYGAMAPWLDYKMLNAIAKKRTDLSFVYIGVNYNGGLDSLEQYENVHYLGPKSYSTLPDYSYWFNCAIIPFKQGEIAKSTSPVKLFEYMAMGLPTVCTRDLNECKGYQYVHMSSSAEMFEKNLDKAISEKSHDKARVALLEQAQNNTWQKRAQDVVEYLTKRGE